MKFLGLIKQLIRDYFIIFGILTIGAVFLTPPDTIDRDYILLVMTFAVIGDLPSIVLWSKSEQSEKNKKFRMIVHFILLELVILIFGGITGIVTGVDGYIIFAIEIAIIYIVVRLINWRGDLSTAKKINDRLKNLKDIGGYEE